MAASQQGWEARRELAQRIKQEREATALWAQVSNFILAELQRLFRKILVATELPEITRLQGEIKAYQRVQRYPQERETELLKEGTD